MPRGGAHGGDCGGRVPSLAWFCLAATLLFFAAVLGVACERGQEEPAEGHGTVHTTENERQRSDQGTSVSVPPCTIVGTGADDILVGTSAADVVCGLGGDDTLTGGPGDDILVGGPGTDTVSYVAAPRGVTVRLAGTAVGEGHDLLRGIEDVQGSRFGDRLVSSRGSNALIGGNGDDRVVSRDGQPYDLLDGGQGRDLCLGDPGDRRKRCRHGLAAAHKRAVPVLMYHVIANPSSGTPNPDLWVGPAALRRQMRFLDRHGYEVVSLQEVYDYWHGGPLPAKAVVLSFDDGFVNHYTRALPILKAHGWAGTLNLALSHYEQKGWGLTTHMVEALIRNNWELDCHSRTHAYLPRLRGPSLASEVSGSRRVLRRMFHVPVNFFAYPSGAYDPAVVATVKRAGFLGATSTEYGFARPNDAYALDRVQILRGDRLDEFAAKIRGS
jgi:peptidoglycan/xylan/chitin deacetylase (PgdA/CDA1 family)